MGNIQLRQQNSWVRGRSFKIQQLNLSPIYPSMAIKLLKSVPISHALPTKISLAVSILLLVSVSNIYFPNYL